MKRAFFKPTLAVVLVATTLIVAAVGYRASQVAPPEDYQHMVAQLRNGRYVDSQVNETLLETRQGLLKHYDPLVARLAEHRRLLADYRRDPILYRQMSASALGADIEALTAAVAAKEEGIEQFKRHYAVWRNSARYLPVIVTELIDEAAATSRPTLAAILNRLLRDALLYNAMPSPEGERQINAQLAALEQERRALPAELGSQVGIAAAHARTLLAEKGVVDTLVRHILAAPTLTASETVLRAYESWYRQQTATVRRYQYGLYATSIALAGYLAYLFVALARASAKLRRSLHDLHREKLALDQHAAVSICSLEGIIVAVNDKFCAISGYAREELIGHKHNIINSGHHPPEYFAGLWATILGGEVFHGETCNRRKDGTLYWIAATILPYKDEHGAIEHLVEISTDITVRKQVEEEIRGFNAQLESKVRERTAQLEEANQGLESFSYSVSHDLRTPLRSIHGFSCAITEDCGTQISAQCRDHLDRIQAASVKMGRIIDDLLQLSRITRVDLQSRPLDLCALVRQVAEAFQQRDPERHVDVVIPTTCPVQGDARLLTIALENLLGNAWKFTRQQPAPHIEFGCQSQGNESIYFVRDNGAGFNMAYADKLFKAFQRLHSDPAFEGTGIGLSIVQRVIQRHGGRIWAEAEEGKGATFYFTLT